jgi:4-amino-4-deoxy-L-arabinose transferase-like glycosyltransferase
MNTQTTWWQLGAMGGSDLRRAYLAVFAAALVVRFTYVLLTFFHLGPDGLMGPDSYGYLATADEFTNRLRSGGLQGWAWLGPDASLMPAYLWFLTGAMTVSMDTGPLAPVLLQGVVDAATCVVIALLAGVVDRRLIMPAGLFAVANPTLVVLSGIVYTDTLFLFGCALGLYAALKWLDAPGWRWAVLLGLALGLAALTRVLIAPWVAIVLAFLAGAALWRHRLNCRRLTQLVGAAALFIALLSPIVLRNYSQYGSLQLTPQAGAHALYWIVPLTMEAKNGTPWAEAAASMQRRYEAQKDPGEENNPFRTSQAKLKLAAETLTSLGAGAIAKAWTFGAAINLFSPSVTIVPTVTRLPHTGFYATPGQSRLEKIWNFFTKIESPVYAWLLVAGSLGVLVLRTIQVFGVTVGFRRDGGVRLPLLLLIGWILFVLVVNGPVASPKYRLLLEPAFAVFFALAFDDLRRRVKRARAAPPRASSP